MWLLAKYTIAGSQLSYATVPFLCPLLCGEIWLCTNTFCIVKNFGGMKFGKTLVTVTAPKPVVNLCMNLNMQQVMLL